MCLSHSFSIFLSKILNGLPYHCLESFTHFQNVLLTANFDLVIFLFKISHKVVPLLTLEVPSGSGLNNCPRISVHCPFIPGALSSTDTCHVVLVAAPARSPHPTPQTPDWRARLIHLHLLAPVQHLARTGCSVNI